MKRVGEWETDINKEICDYTIWQETFKKRQECEKLGVTFLLGNHSDMNKIKMRGFCACSWFHNTGSSK